jgi:osmotically-inducible protein OsmY
MTDKRKDQRDEREGLVIGPTSRGPDVESAPRGYAARGGLRGDREIAGDVGRRLREHGSLDASAIDVEVRDGEVTLAGRVSDEPARHVAELIADAVPGVRAVVNRLDTAAG